MFKSVIKTVILTLFFYSSAFAHSFTCTSIDDNQPYEIEKIELVTAQDLGTQVFLEFDRLKVKELYEQDLTQKRKKETDPLKFKVVDPHYDAYPEDVLTPFYIDPLIMTGMDGIIKISGWGYHWAQYRCVARRQK